MSGQLPLISTILVIVGSVLAAVGALMCVRPAFKVNLLWGAACIVIPMATMLFPFVSWAEYKRLFYIQFIGIVMLMGGTGLWMSDPETRAGLDNALQHNGQVAQVVDNAPDPDGVPDSPKMPDIISQLLGGHASAPKVVNAKPSPPAAARPEPIAAASPKQIQQAPAMQPPPVQAPTVQAATVSPEEQRRRAGQLYESLQAWSTRLEMRRPKTLASQTEIKAFNDEYAHYQQMLDEYKKEAAALKPTPR